MHSTVFTEHLLCVSYMPNVVGERVLKIQAFDFGWEDRPGGWGGALEDQAALLGAKGKDQLLGQEGFSCQWPKVAWF